MEEDFSASIPDLLSVMLAFGSLGLIILYAYIERWCEERQAEMSKEEADQESGYINDTINWDCFALTTKK